jgi:hypothetical protein
MPVHKMFEDEKKRLKGLYENVKICTEEGLEDLVDYYYDFINKVEHRVSYLKKIVQLEKEDEGKDRGLQDFRRRAYAFCPAAGICPHDANLEECGRCHEFLPHLILDLPVTLLFDLEEDGVRCPRCGRYNTHSCKALDRTSGSADFSKRVIRRGNNCKKTEWLDDATISHCDDCGYLWCLECRAELDIEKPVCMHWTICRECPNGSLAAEKVTTEECMRLCGRRECIIEPANCPTANRHLCNYRSRVHECPRIKRALAKFK